MKNQIVSQLKSMIEEIAISEGKKYNINMNINGYTILDYLNTEALQKKISLQKKSLLLIKSFVEFKRLYGYYNVYDNKISILFRNKMYKSNDLPRVIFHECRHRYQSQANNYIEFLYDIENILVNTNKKIYHQYHDTFFIELDANKYGYEMATKYLSKYNILSEKQKNTYELGLKLNNCYLEGYNPIYLFHQFNNCLIENSDKDWFKKIYPNSWLKEIYDKSGNMKSYKEIFQNNYFKSLDETSQSIIIISPYFLDNIDINNLNGYEKEMILRSIKYAKTIKERNDKQNFDIIKEMVKNNIVSINMLENIIYQKRTNFLINNGIQTHLEPILEQLNNESIYSNNETDKQR